MSRYKTTALLGLAMALACPHAAAAYDETPVPPIIPQASDQKGAMWGVTEVMHCPDGYQLMLDPKGKAPFCIPLVPASQVGAQ